MFPGVSQDQMDRAKVIGENVVAEIRANYADGEIYIKFKPITPAGAPWVMDLTKQLTQSMATQLSTFFNIKGTIKTTTKPLVPISFKRQVDQKGLPSQMVSKDEQE
ncbi:MAG: hypothetical protein PHI12_13490 [Dehalococcoidales bacterium]|nr:hypothetical protein [Dehalococcoidales bacterium]